MSLARYPVALAMLFLPAAVNAIERSPVPLPRPVYLSISEAARLEEIPQRPPVFGAGTQTIRPRPRPARAPLSEPGPEPSARGAGLAVSPVPAPRPAGWGTRVASAPPDRVIIPRSDIGRLCNDADIRGRALAPIRGAAGQCGLRNPVEVVSVDGAALTPPAVVDCDTARTLADWVRDGVRPAVGRLGGGVRGLQLGDSYSCVPPAGEAGAEISAHGQGQAVDVTAIDLKDADALEFGGDWGDGPAGLLLKRVHGAACEAFATVLGPVAGGDHSGHLHLDTARGRTGAYCR